MGARQPGEFSFIIVHLKITYDYNNCLVADIPGLIKGSHKNLGLGVAFLKHIRRCSCLLYVLDASEGDPLEQFEILR